MEVDCFCFLAGGGDLEECELLDALTDAKMLTSSKKGILQTGLSAQVSSSRRSRLYHQGDRTYDIVTDVYLLSRGWVDLRLPSA